MSNGNYIENASIARPRQLLIIFLTVRLYFDLQIKITVCRVGNWIDNFKMLFSLTCCLVKANKTPEDESRENKTLIYSSLPPPQRNSIEWHNLCSKKRSSFILFIFAEMNNFRIESKCNHDRGYIGTLVQDIDLRSFTFSISV